MTICNNKDENSYMNYDGPLIIQIISTFARFLLKNTTDSEVVSKKLYRIFIELAQNVALYSMDRVTLTNNIIVGKGIVNIIENESEFKCITINKVLDEHVPILINYCTEINSTSIEALKAKKKDLYKLSSTQASGAHIGLIMIYMYSGNLLDFEIIDNGIKGKYFKLGVTINRK